MEIIVGTAGHIDHGKTALVRALTGTDADRLPEEKRRGITIDIGFAELAAGGHHFGFVDVPGHERFVKNMLAGAGGIDIVLLVIAGDEGVMPQTREHFDICRLLGIAHGLVVITKRDLIDDEMSELVRLDSAELVNGSFLATAPVVEVSSTTGEGLDELTSRLVELASAVGVRSKVHSTFLPIDRSFSMKGFGAVVTGTLVSGEIKDGAELELAPVGRRVRVRGVQTHGRAAVTAGAGQRTAVNLAGIDHAEIERGMVLTEGSLRPTQVLDATVEMLGSAPRALKSRHRVRVHIGTAEVLARVAVLEASREVAAGDKGMVQLRLESPVVCHMGQRFILRSYSPQTTIGGGRVLLPNAVKRRGKEAAAAVEMLGELSKSLEDNVRVAEILVEAAGSAGLELSELAAQTGWREETVNGAVVELVSSGRVVRAGERLILAVEFAQMTARLERAVSGFHKAEPLASGMPRETLREREFRYIPAAVFNGVVEAATVGGKIEADKEVVRLSGHRTELSPAAAAFRDALMQTYNAAGVSPPKLEESVASAGAEGGKLSAAEIAKIVAMLIKQGELVKVTEEFLFAAAAVNDLVEKVRSYADGTTDRLIDVAKFKEIAGISRKYAIPLLEYFDRERVTVRAGDKRLVLK